MANNDDVFDPVNDRIARWANDRMPDLRTSIAQAGIKHVKRSPSKRAAVNSLRKTLRKNKGIISNIGYSIPRHMVFVEKGVGRGTTIGQAGNTTRRAKPWYNPVIDKNIEDLADIVAEELGSAIINNLLIK